MLKCKDVERLMALAAEGIDGLSWQRFATVFEQAVRFWCNGHCCDDADDPFSPPPEVDGTAAVPAENASTQIRDRAPPSTQETKILL